MSSIARYLRRRRAGASAWALLALTACAGARPVPPTTVEAAAFHYQDNSGLTVGTYAAVVRQELPVGLRLDLRGLADFIHLSSRTLVDPTRDPTRPRSADVVTSASATISGGEVAKKWRLEAQGGLSWQRTLGTSPVEIAAVARISDEKDYHSLAGGLRLGAELLAQNLVTTLFIGYGRDDVTPVEAPPGQAELWPARHDRVAASFTASQILSPRLVLSAGSGVTLQRGQLANPYRRTIVVNALYPEVVPDRRRRHTAFATLAWHLGAGTALHLRQGFYLDDWGVAALVPEAVIARELAPDTTLSLRYRCYRQWSADFFQLVYPELQAVMTGDPRLGPIIEHVAGLEVRWDLDQVRGLDALPIRLGYDLSLLEYMATQTRVIAHVFLLGVEATF